MPLSIFIDALAYTYIKDNMDTLAVGDTRAVILKPDLGYSSNLHWMLYCGKTPDDIGAFTDWILEPETNKTVSAISKLFSPLDRLPLLGILARKFLDRIMFRKHLFANIPFAFRPAFSNKAKYLFWDGERCAREAVFDGYELVLQDERKSTFEDTIAALAKVIDLGQKDVFAAFGFADEIGHKHRRGDEYDRIITEHMKALGDTIERYAKANPSEEIVIASDHGMSTVTRSIDIDLKSRFGRESKRTYIAYKDSTIMRIYAADDALLTGIRNYLETRAEGKVISDEERKLYGVTDLRFGSLIFVLREGFVFTDNWFGVALRKQNRKSPTGNGMHGFLPEDRENDHDACVVLMNSSRHMESQYDYRSANKLLADIMGRNT